VFTTAALETGKLVGVVQVLATFDNLVDLYAPVPQPDVYATLALSPDPLAAFEVNFILTILPVKLPESNVADEPNVPINDHCQPVNSGVVAVDVGNTGAVYLYTLLPHTSLTNVITGAVAGVGVTNAAFVSFNLAAKLFPQLDVYCNLTLSAPAAALLV
jgi:hypothetical protein